jgi:hypothetical protein
MKEDGINRKLFKYINYFFIIVQLICPLGYEDPSNAWTSLEKDLLPLLPLDKISFKNPLNQSDVKVDSLPLRCMQMSSNLFKDTDHPFRWFLAPYVDIFLLICETVEAYKLTKPKLKSWIASQNAIRR